jgi:dipeptide/tripeptide permease
MGTVFTGGAVSTALAGVLHDAYGWTGVTVLAAVLPLIGLVVWLTGPTTAPLPAERSVIADQPVTG